MVEIKNHANAYELVFNEPKKVNFNSFKKKLEDFLKKNKPKETFKGTYYIKKMSVIDDNLICLFGKDNPDASNQKREKKSLDFAPIDVDKEKEVLTDFIHFSISKKAKKEGVKQLHTLLIEKSSLISMHNIKEFIINILEDAFTVELRRRITKDLYSAVRNSRRILEINISKEVENPILPSNNNDDNDNVTTKEIIELKAGRKKSIPIPFFEKSLENFNIKDKSQKLYVKIQDEGSNMVNIDFSKVDAAYSVKYDIPLNRKEDDIQTDIAEQLNRLLKLSDKGKI